MRPARPGIVPSLYAADHADLSGAVADCVAAGAERLHYDVMDGHFAPRLGLTPEGLGAVVRRHPSLPVDVHLMVDAPEHHLAEFLRAGPASVAVHVEAAPARVASWIAAVHRAGVVAGLAVRPRTAVDHLDRFFGQIDFVLVMLIEPGHVGARAQPAMIERVAKLRRCRPDLIIACDGGVDAGAAVAAAAAGADWIVAGSAVFGPGTAVGLPRLQQAVAAADA